MAGMIMDWWQRSLSDVGVVGPDKGEGGKYLILGPGQEDPKADGYIVIKSTTWNVFFGVRANPPKEQVVILYAPVLIDRFSFMRSSIASTVTPCAFFVGRLFR